jgi:hypothetical protein
LRILDLIAGNIKFGVARFLSQQSVDNVNAASPLQFSASLAAVTPHQLPQKGRQSWNTVIDPV